ncbi:MAG: hypothetical protein ACKOXR_04015 [Bacteroidota bacterium]
MDRDLFMIKVPQNYKNFYKKSPAFAGLFKLHINECVMIISLSGWLARFTLGSSTSFKHHRRSKKQQQDQNSPFL